ncbi:MAG: Gfo/Idh/MocA family oxidoreductase [Parvularculaceae bacterium]|nr:Gfo/Idh/MocA family oxidoreductase [Parvularculaceae bacterium]
MDAIIRPAALMPNVSVHGIAASESTRAQRYAQQVDIPKAYETAEELYAAPAIDLVYIGLPPSAHASVAIAALKAGRDVLCEKPLALDATEAKTMADVAVAEDRLLIEAFHYRYHPLMQRLLGIVESGCLGEIYDIQAHFSVPVPQTAGEFRYNPTLGGGALMDLGCYPIHWIRTVTGTEPIVLEAEVLALQNGVDVTTRAVLSVSDTCRAEVYCSMSERLPRGIDAGLEVRGTQGRVILSNPLQPEFGSVLTLEVGGGREVSTFDGSTFPHQLRDVLARLEDRSQPLTGGEDAVANMAVIDAIRALATTDRIQEVG